MTTLTFKGKQYQINDLLKDIVLSADDLAENARLKDPLPTDTDLTDAEQEKVQQQIPAMLILPEKIVHAFWGSFTAHHLPRLVSSLRTLSPTTQPRAIATYIQILSLLPDPKIEPYFRKFLHQTKDNFPTIIAEAFVRGVTWKRPSGPGHICTLLIHVLFWCKTSLGDDKRASIDATVRAALARKLKAILEIPSFDRLEPGQQVEIDRLAGILNTVDVMPGDAFLASTQQYLANQLDCCANMECAEEAKMTCSRCKSVRYCGKQCQQVEWKKGHKLTCFETAY